MAVLPGDVLGVVIPFTHLFGCALLGHGLRGGASGVGLNPGPDPQAFLAARCDEATARVEPAICTQLGQ